MAKVIKKQYAVIGLGRFGMALVRGLNAEGAEILVIDSDPDKVNEIEPYCTQAICADATDEAVLEKIGIRNLDVVIVCIAGDIESSIFVTLTCKQLGVPKVIAKAQNERHRHVLKKIGADMVIVPEEEMGAKLAANLVKPNMIEIMSLSDNFRMVEIRTPIKWRNRTPAQLNLRNTEKVTIVLIKRGDEIIVTPNAQCELLPDDILVIAGTYTDTKRLSSKATETVLDTLE
ncbi:MAG: TrkA family potassium uptake protein [Clostridia bacterium]|jgi:trk system potassium uptake protein TrkA|nr:TrkA family potassium uptake protein [Clostridia bacterium]